MKTLEKTLRSLIALAVFSAGIYLIYLAFHSFVGLKQLSEVGILDILKIFGLAMASLLVSMLAKAIGNSMPIFMESLFCIAICITGILLLFLTPVVLDELWIAGPLTETGRDLSEFCYDYPLVRESSRPEIEISLSGIVVFLKNTLTFFGSIAIFGVGGAMIVRACYPEYLKEESETDSKSESNL